MYIINCGVNATDGIQIEFDDIEDFYVFNKRREDKHNPNHVINAFVKSINQQVVFIDEYNNGLYEWYVVGGKFLNNLEPLLWHPLEDYIE